MDRHCEISDLLHARGLKKTPIRTEILNIFMNNEFALSASDIIARLKTNNDRVTVYRALSSFEVHGLLHKASYDKQGAYYALCDHDCTEKAHRDHHAHFICNECHHTFCLNDIAVPELSISGDFSVDRFEYTLGGVCKECKSHTRLN